MVSTFAGAFFAASAFAPDEAAGFGAVFDADAFPAPADGAGFAPPAPAEFDGVPAAGRVGADRVGVSADHSGNTAISARIVAK